MVGFRQCNRFVGPKLEELVRKAPQYSLWFHDALNVQKKEFVEDESFQNACDGGCYLCARWSLDYI